MDKIKHIAPPNWIIRGFDKWICGDTAFSHDSADIPKFATCVKCLKHFYSCNICKEWNTRND